MAFLGRSAAFRRGAEPAWTRRRQPAPRRNASSVLAALRRSRGGLRHRQARGCRLRADAARAAGARGALAGGRARGRHPGRAGRAALAGAAARAARPRPRRARASARAAAPASRLPPQSRPPDERARRCGRPVSASASAVRRRWTASTSSWRRARAWRCWDRTAPGKIDAAAAARGAGAPDFGLAPRGWGHARRISRRAPAGGLHRPRLALVSRLTARENLLFAARLHQVPDVDARVERWLERAGLSGVAALPVSHFSRGMSQRARDRARAGARPAPVAARRALRGPGCARREPARRAARRAAPAGRTLVLVTHDLSARRSSATAPSCWRRGGSPSTARAGQAGAQTLERALLAASDSVSVLLAILWKDLVTEWRSRDRVAAMLASSRCWW